ncbi:uncharacterized protein LOC106054553 isoform X2 [Biomphalaria glabrata]|uniref:Uncharacterized protein LOC106054553 isoform X2 n=1 Tax=Biomphalaria glabrata TaxID=6526 RepID=A0A9W3B4X2_BIOGL|nr:uncharacterized protein LOC106054553 isoform X2 [Biomphalaria glabrata]XP_055894576.1 uncharacterized protein LOC106054553 isoform X2 [Biomphalaria glabrata]XP_055894577.1 uncharacterized protein LOC106054553 isoform X2 [Biomphalaria glabrata]XP_055894578.1 uncharacterized protein LOC106054553 isoform X2 [Biomphalaria glabrata]
MSKVSLSMFLVTIATIVYVLSRCVTTHNYSAMIHPSDTYEEKHGSLYVRQSGYFQSIIRSELNITRIVHSEVWHTRNELFVYPEDAPTSTGETSKKIKPIFLVYYCNSNARCSNWGESQEGLTFVYSLSRLVDRHFKMIMPNPCNLSQYFTPNKVPWAPLKGELTPPTENNTIDTTTDQGKRDFIANIQAGDFNVKYRHDTVYIRANRDLQDTIFGDTFYAKRIQDWKVTMNARIRFHLAWHELMRPSTEMISSLKHILGESFLIRKGLLPPSENPRRDSMYDVADSQLVCAHVPKPLHTEEENVQTVDIKALHNFMSSKGQLGSSHFFIATDDRNIFVQSKHFFQNHLIDYGAKTLHKYYLQNSMSACDRLTDVVTDQMILSLCDVLIVSHSLVGRLAYFMSNITQSVFLIDNGHIKSLNT